VVVERRGRQGLSCRDGIRVDVRATFLLKGEREVGSGRASREEEVQGLFEERFAGVLESAASTFTFEELAADRGLFIEHVMMEVGNELSGFKLERVSLGKLEQTPLDQLDATNEQDARGILTRTERATGLAVEKTEQERYRLWMEEVPWQAGEDREADALALTAALSQRIEAAIRRAPEQWVWMHQRWKTRPPPTPAR